jgi:CubicO group peptidase (beta-lactamase class C family)
MNRRFTAFITSLGILTAFLVSCSNNDTKKSNNEKQEELIKKYDIPDEEKLSANDRANFKTQCQRFYDTVLSMSGFNGGIIVAKHGHVVFEKYKGSVDLDHQDSINKNTPLHIASVSKTFTAMAILKLQEQGKLNVNDTLTKYFPNFNYPGVTIKCLLTHRSGLPNYLYFMDEMKWNKDSLVVQNKDVLNYITKYKSKAGDIAPANTKFTYNNTNYVLLALLIEKITGQKYQVYMRRNIFLPLGMTHTFVHCKGDTMRRSKSFDWKGREILDNHLDETYGDKNIYTTPRDLLKWDRALTHNVFLSKETQAAAYTPYSNEKPGIKNYGFGWRMNIYGEDKKIIFHTGWWHGNNATFIRLLKEDATIIVISNRFARSVYGAKLLVNVFGNYFDPVGEDTENIIPSTIPETFTDEQKFNQSEQHYDRFDDRYKKQKTKQKVVEELKSDDGKFRDLNKKEE